MEELLAHHPLRDRFEMERIIINDVPELESQYGTKVPVLLEQSAEICHYFLDEKRLREHLSN